MNMKEEEVGMFGNWGKISPYRETAYVFHVVQLVGPSWMLSY